MTEEADYAKFQRELAVVLAANGIKTYLLGVVLHSKEADETQVPVCFNVVGDRERKLPAPRMASAFVQELLGSLLRMLMQFCGLSLTQALGAIRESVESAAAEIQAESVAVRRGAEYDDVDGAP